MINKLFLLLFLLSMSACTTISVQAPSTRFMTPESQGERIFRGRAKAGANSGGEVDVVHDKYSNTPDTEPSLGEESGMHAGVEMNFLPRLDAYLTYNYNSYTVAGVKFQILGSNVKDAAADEMSLAIGGGALFGSGESAKDEEAGVEVKADTDFSGYEYFVLVGFRPHNKWLLYTGPWIAEWDLDTKIHRTESGTTTITADLKGEGKQESILFGFQFGRTFQLNVEGAFTKLEYKKTSPTVSALKDKEFFAYGATFGFGW